MFNHRNFLNFPTEKWTYLAFENFVDEIIQQAILSQTLNFQWLLDTYTLYGLTECVTKVVPECFIQKKNTIFPTIICQESLSVCLSYNFFLSNLVLIKEI